MQAILKNLKDQLLTDDKKIMYCPRCNAEYSAHRGDYFTINDPEHIFYCGCGNPLLLVIKQVIYNME
jgi:uncharacterized C2H2 Zn-finger protein